MKKYCVQFVCNNLNYGLCETHEFFIYGNSWIDAMLIAKNYYRNCKYYELENDTTIVDAIEMILFNCDEFNKIDATTNYIVFE